MTNYKVDENTWTETEATCPWVSYPNIKFKPLCYLLNKKHFNHWNHNESDACQESELTVYKTASTSFWNYDLSNKSSAGTSIADIRLLGLHNTAGKKSWNMLTDWEQQCLLNGLQIVLRLLEGNQGGNRKNRQTIRLY